MMVLASSLQMFQDATEPGWISTSASTTGEVLKWTNIGLVDSLTFLDLTVKITNFNFLEFETYTKPMNLHLCLPLTSAHPPDTIKSS